MNRTISEKVGYWVDEGIDLHGQGENILWESGLLAGPHSEPVFTVFIWFPGAVLSTTLNGSFQIPDPLGVTKKDVLDMMAEFLRQMREARSQQVAAQPLTPPRGSQTPSGILIG